MFSEQPLVVLNTLIPQGDEGGLPGLMESGFEDFYRDRFSQDAPLPMRLVFHLALFAGGWLSPFMIGKMAPISRLSVDERENALLAMGKSSNYIIRQLYVLLKTTVCLGYGGEQSIRSTIGYPEQFDGGKGAASLEVQEVSNDL